MMGVARNMAIAAAVLATTVQGDGPFALNGMEYTFVTTEMAWSDAQFYCSGELGGHLAAYHSADDQAAIYAGVGAPGPCSDATMWNGLNDKLAENAWVWTDGSDVDFTAWNPGEPNNAGPGEDCAENDATTWNDLDCSTTQCFICQAVPATPTAGPAAVPTAAPAAGLAPGPAAGPAAAPGAPTFPYAAGAVDSDAMDVVNTVLDGAPLTQGRLADSPANGLVTGVLNGNFDEGGSLVPSDLKNRVMSVDETTAAASDSSSHTAVTAFTALMVIGCVAGLLVVVGKFALKKREFEPLLTKDQNNVSSPIVATQVYGTTVAAEASSLWLSEKKKMGAESEQNL